MKRILLLVEGNTEEVFVRDLLQPRYPSVDIRATCVNTSASRKGGITSYAKLRPQILRLCDYKDAHISTMFDLYALPDDFPGAVRGKSLCTGQERAKLIEQDMRDDINRSNFIPNIVVHEFEALLFSRTECFKEWADDPVVKELTSVCRKKNGNPEDINDSPQTAPSKQILRFMPTYQKNLHGPLIAQAIGLDTIRANCPHFDSWLKKLEGII